MEFRKAGWCPGQNPVTIDGVTMRRIMHMEDIPGMPSLEDLRGKQILYRDGKPIKVLNIGDLLPPSYGKADAVALHPLDYEHLLESAERTKRIIKQKNRTLPRGYAPRSHFLH